MPPALYLINPASDFPTYFSAEVFAACGLRPATYMADLATTTLAAMATPHVPVDICDENVTAIDFDHEAEYVGITGKLTQYSRMVAVAQRFRAAGKTVLIGGPCASLSPDLLRAHCDILVRGEIEEISDELFSALRAGTWKDEYVGTRPDLAGSPTPRWDKYPNHRAMSGTLQTSRGCPFECEFCDVIQYLGRKQRHKPIAQVLHELDVLYRYGYRSVFLADDNFTVYRARAKELLAAMRAWNERQSDGPVHFITQVSIDAARDDELLRMCATAGLRQVFVGIETPNVESLRETKKRQNLHGDLVAEVQRFIDHGIVVYAGMIVGFDHDGPEIFRRQYEFASATPIPVFSLGALVAPAATPLHDRMAAAGRLVEGSEVAAMPWSTNIEPRAITRDELFHGMRWLCNSLYAPGEFGARVFKLLDGLRGTLPASPRSAAINARKPETLPSDLRMLVAQLGSLGAEESQMLEKILARLTEQREARYFVGAHLVQYMQVRHMYAYGRFWDPRPTA
ncbi:MAG: radical SAM protein [Deltaproteobacteria bacterium]|nr:radical SAM protein [Deltaproteobacteria bacterium]